MWQSLLDLRSVSSMSTRWQWPWRWKGQT